VNISSILLWGFVSTVVLTTIMAASQGLGLTRMSIPFLVGTMITPDRDRAMVLGVAAHFFNGWIFAIVYGLAFESWQVATSWLGAGVGRESDLSMRCSFCLFSCRFYPVCTRGWSANITAPRPIDGSNLRASLRSIMVTAPL
jgi:hypothetical protein